MKIAIIGTGYVGLVSGACFAKMGHEVCCMDINAERIAALKTGHSLIYEKGLEELLRDGLSSGRLSFTAEYDNSVGSAEVVFVAVATPTSATDGRADTSMLFKALAQVAGTIEDYTLVVIKSTAPIGTHAKASAFLEKRCERENFDIAVNPEFLREGSGVHDFLNPDRIILGTDSARGRAILDQVYRGLEQKILHTSMGNAELIKYVSNSILASRIVFTNEVADLCKELDLDIGEVTKGVGLDRRIGTHFMKAGPGFGGSCFPKDSLELLSAAQAVGSPMSVLQAVLEANQHRQKKLISEITRLLDSLKNKTVGILGTTFKEGTDDMRNSFALNLVPALQEAGAKVKAYDPAGMKNAGELLQNIDWCPDAYTVGKGCSMLVIHTGWEEFLKLNWQRMREEMASPLVYDLRNICDPVAMQDLGFDYFSIGRPAVRQSPLPSRRPAQAKPKWSSAVQA